MNAFAQMLDQLVVYAWFNSKKTSVIVIKKQRLMLQTEWQRCFLLSIDFCYQIANIAEIVFD